MSKLKSLNNLNPLTCFRKLLTTVANLAIDLSHSLRYPLIALSIMIAILTITIIFLVLSTSDVIIEETYDNQISDTVYDVIPSSAFRLLIIGTCFSFLIVIMGFIMCLGEWCGKKEDVKKNVDSCMSIINCNNCFGLC